MISDGSLPTLSAFISEQRKWLDSDEYVKQLHSEPDLKASTFMGMTELQMAEALDSSADVESAAFRASAVAGNVGTPFTWGLYFRQSFFSSSERVKQGALRFLPTTSADARTVSYGAIGAAFDEILADVSSDGLPLFTASLVVEPCPDQNGKMIDVPVATTLRYLGEFDRKEKTSKGASKCYVSGSLLSIDGATLYARASALFISPAGMNARKKTEAEDAELLQKSVPERIAALRTMCHNTGCWQFMTHLPNFEHASEQWAQSLGPGYFVDFPELRGKVFTCLLSHSSGSNFHAIAKFSCCALGPPFTAHGGSRFALLLQTALQACLFDEGEASLDLKRCEVNMKARLPLNATVRVEMNVSRKQIVSGSKQIYLEGQLTNLEGTVVYDTVKAEVACTPSVFTSAQEVFPSSTTVISAKL
jgi:hypothetical protein